MKKPILTIAVLLIAGLAIAAPYQFPQIIKEGSTAFLSLKFQDHSGVAVIPSAASVRVLDKATNTVLCTEPTPSTYASLLSYELKPGCNKIINTTRDAEQHRVEVVFTYQGGTKTGSDFGEYQTDNIPGMAVGCAPTPTGTPAEPVCGLTPVATPTP